MRRMTPILLALLLGGCSGSPMVRSNVVTSSGGHEIVALRDQHQVWECPKCGMMFDKAGACPMDTTALVLEKVDYFCPTDQKPVGHAGSCPRCAAMVIVQKTAAAPSEVPPAGGK